MINTGAPASPATSGGCCSSSSDYSPCCGRCFFRIHIGAARTARQPQPVCRWAQVQTRFMGGQCPREGNAVIDLDVVTLSRLQFALTALYHFLFIPLTLGLS